jgi:hypothetical protein
MATGSDARIEALYALPLEEFTAARNALAKELASAGDEQGAERVRSLGKPTRAAWIVNQLVRDEREDVKALIDAGDRLRKAQRRAVSGRGPEEFRERADERRRLISGLVERARGYEGGAGAADQVGATLDAASADPEAGRLVLAGTLTKPLPPPTGFSDAAGLEVLTGGRTERTPAAAPDRAEERARTERDLADAERREAVARERVESLQRDLEQVQASIADLREQVLAAEAEARGASMEVRRLRSRLR